jgi:hypothetical protein
MRLVIRPSYGLNVWMPQTLTKLAGALNVAMIGRKPIGPVKPLSLHTSVICQFCAFDTFVCGCAIFVPDEAHFPSLFVEREGSTTIIKTGSLPSILTFFCGRRDIARVVWVALKGDVLR